MTGRYYGIKCHRVKHIKGKYSKHELMEVSIGAEILSWILPVLIFVLWLISLISALKSEFKYPVDKLVWVLVSFIPLLGPILYFVIGRKKHKTEG